jgi:hypothetical protein
MEALETIISILMGPWDIFGVIVSVTGSRAVVGRTAELAWGLSWGQGAFSKSASFRIGAVTGLKLEMAVFVETGSFVGLWEASFVFIFEKNRSLRFSVTFWVDWWLISLVSLGSSVSFRLLEPVLELKNRLGSWEGGTGVTEGVGRTLDTSLKLF